MSPGKVIYSKLLQSDLQLLPYHKFGVPKYERVGKSYPLPEIAFPSKESMQQHKELFESYGLTVQIG